MGRSSLAIVVVMSLASVSFADDRDSATAIKTVLTEQVTAWNKGDLTGYMNGYWKSESLTFSSGGTYTKGWQPVYDRYKARYFAEGKERGELTFDNIEVEMLGSDAGFVKGKWLAKMKGDQSEGLFTLVMKKIDGNWRIVHDHTSVKETPKK